MCRIDAAHDVTREVASALNDVAEGGDITLDLAAAGSPATEGGHEPIAPGGKREAPKDESVVLALPAELGDKAWRFIVNCSDDGHKDDKDAVRRQNVFDSKQLEKLPPSPSDLHVITGWGPTVEDLSLARVSVATGIESADARLDTFFKTLVGVLTTIATLVTGFGIYKGTSESINGVWDVIALAVPVVLAGLGVACGLWALAPRLGRPGSVLNLRAIQDVTKAQVADRTRWMRWATGFFVATAVSAPIVIFALAPDDEPSSTPAISATFASGKSSTLTTDVKVGEIPKGGRMHVRIVARKQPPSAHKTKSAKHPKAVEVVLLDSTVTAENDDQAGDVSNEFPNAAGYKKVTITAIVLDGDGKQTATQTVRLRPAQKPTKK